MRYVIGIDIGTTNTKAVAFTETGQVLGSVETSYPVFTDAAGAHELEPNALFDAALTVLLQITEKLDPAGAAAVSFSCAMHSLILVDADGKPLSRAMTWADRRSEAYAAALKGSELGRRLYRQTGTPIHAMSPLCKLLWLKDRQPELFRKAAKFISIKEYVWWRFLGQYQVDHSLASATGLFDIRALGWSAEALEHVGIRADRLSTPVPTTHRETELLSTWRTMGLVRGTPFVIGGSDGCLANLGTGAVRPGATALTIGTSGAVRMAALAPADDPRMRIFNYILTEGRYIVGGATNNGGNAVQWYADFVSGDHDAGTLDRLSAAAGTVPAGADGLIFLPYLLGERAPVWDADATGVFFGVRAMHRQEHFMRATLEGISYGLRQIGASLEETVGPVERIYASGGFTRNRDWLQLIADIFQKKVCVTALADASAIGAAMLAWVALGVLSLEETAALAAVSDIYEPVADLAKVYQHNYRIFSQLYDRLKDLM
ncbi:MAG TPA: gluconokinase [Puia sp.]|nr:gluconokinase [Puia sp.]